MVAELKESAITVWPETSCVQTDLKQKLLSPPVLTVGSHSLGQQLVQKVLSLLLLTEIVLRPLRDEALQVVGVLLHPEHHGLQGQSHGVDTVRGE